jgi:hypothetical protein
MALVLLMLCVLLLGGCSSPSGSEIPRRHGPKVNLRDFFYNTAAYKGKSITLDLKVDEPLFRSKGQSLRDYAGQEVKFLKTGPRGELLSLVIKLPQDLSIPEPSSDSVSVTFVCTRGSLRQGNEAKAIELSF